MMDMMELAGLIVSPEEWLVFQEAIRLLERDDYAGFYGKFPGVVQRVLFIDNREEFLDFAGENALDRECVCAALLCERGYGLSVGGYEEDLTPALTGFLQARGAAFPEVLEIIRREKIYTDCADFDNFKKSLTEVNQVLDSRGLRLAVWEDCVYCDCEYTLLLLKKELAEQTARWQSENFEIYL